VSGFATRRCRDAGAVALTPRASPTRSPLWMRPESRIGFLSSLWQMPRMNDPGRFTGTLLSLGVLLFASCTADSRDPVLMLSPPLPMESPAGTGSSEPTLTVDLDGVVHLTWQQAMGDRHELRFATLRGEGWSPARTIASGDDWFVNWADFPTLAVLPDGGLAANYLKRHGTGGRYHYDVEVVQSRDGGATWSSPVRPHRDSVPAEHGFVSLFPAGADGLGIVWLDGRKYDARFGATEEMMLRHTTLSADGALGPEDVIDERVCDCCQTSWARSARGDVIAYRGRSADEVRDIHLARKVDGRWISGVVHPDGWQIAACPVNGPAVAANGDHVAVAWFTAARDTSRVRIAFSADAGATFGSPVEVDSGDPVGRVDILYLSENRVLVSWLERVGGEEAEIRARVVGPGGAGPPQLIARSSGARASGFPRMARSGDAVVFAWTEAGDESHVRVARFNIESSR
jgi:hypothetical protein